MYAVISTTRRRGGEREGDEKLESEQKEMLVNVGRVKFSGIPVLPVIPNGNEQSREILRCCKIQYVHKSVEMLYNDK